MDRVKKDWSWLAEHMPRTAAMLREYREAGEGAHVDECWKRGVLAGEAGWFYAREGPIALGTPFEPGQLLTLGEMEQWEHARTKTWLQLAPLPIGKGGSDGLLRRARNRWPEGSRYGAN